MAKSTYADGLRDAITTLQAMLLAAQASSRPASPVPLSTTHPTAEEIEAARTPAGGWTRATLAGWGVPWPPPKGWRKRLEGLDK